MDSLSSDEMMEVTEMLSPVDAASLGACQRRVREQMGVLAQPPLRIQIATSNRRHVLDHSFFVSDENGRMLRQHERLFFERSYRLWVYDDERSQQVNLIDHLPYGDKKEVTDVALIVKQRSCTDPPRCVRWKVSGGNPGEPVAWMASTTLTVVRDAGSMQSYEKNAQRVLTAQRSLRDSENDAMPPFIWFVSRTKVDPEAQSMMLVPTHHPEANWKAAGGPTPLYTHLEIRAQHVFQTRSSIKILSPRSIGTGSLTPFRHHALVGFELWTTNTHMYMSCSALHFALAIPLCFNSSYDQVHNEHELMDIMYNLHPDTIFARELYLVTAAFVQGSSSKWPLERYAAHHDMRTKGTFSKEVNVYKLNYIPTPKYSWQSKFSPIPRDPSRKFHALLVSEAAL